MTYAYRPQRLEKLVDAEPCLWTSRERPGAKLGLMFACPIHAEHCYIGVQFENPSDGGHPEDPGRPAWKWNGEQDFARLTLSPSIRILGTAETCRWHGFIRNGRFEHCGDAR